MELNAEKKRHLAALEKMRRAELASDEAFDRHQGLEDDDEDHTRLPGGPGDRQSDNFLGRLFSFGKSPRKTLSEPPTPGGRPVYTF